MNFTMKWENTSAHQQQWAITSNRHPDENFNIQSNDSTSEDRTIHNGDKFEITVNPGAATATLKYNDSKKWTLTGNPEDDWTLKQTDHTVTVKCSS